MPQKSSLGLCLIAKEYSEVERIVRLYGSFFDKIYIQLNGGGKKPAKVPENVHLSTFAWVNDFSKARNALLKEVETDFWMWIDTDDDIVNPEGLREILKNMGSEVDAVYLEYIYGYNEQREPIAVHWRERVVRTSHPFEWKGPVHETLISEQSPVLVQDSSVTIKHAYKGEEDFMKSALRNHEIMEKAVKDGDEDPRLLYYLGRSYFMLKSYSEAAQTLLIYTDLSGWDEQKYDAWCKIADCLLLMDEQDRAVNSIWEAIKLNPTHPEAYLKLGDLYLHLERPVHAIHWLKVGKALPQPQTLEIVDPTLYTYRPLISLALAHFGQAKVNEAKRFIDEAAKFKPKTPMFESAFKYITTAYLEEQSIKQAAWLGKFAEQQGNLQKYIEGLPPFIKNDLRLRPLRVKAFPPKKWPSKSIVFYCGEQWEEWGPDTLHKGMGGSEEAIVYLSRELAKLGWDVHVYNQRVEELIDEPYHSNYKVHYHPWETFNPEDEFDVFVAWRSPRMIEKLKIKARVKCVDMHDTPIGHQAYTPKALESVDKVFLKSEYQRAMGDIPKDKAVIVPNGIVPEQFVNPGIKREPHKVIYASSADRGLNLLVRTIWPEVLKEVPNAQLVWPYGWDSFDGMHKGNPTQGKWKWELKRDMQLAGVKELGRLSHEDLAKEMMSCSVWAYPTSFPEIDCITAKKVQAAGCDVVTSGFAALQGSVLKDEEEIENIHEKPEEIEKFTKRLIDALKNPTPLTERQKVAEQIINKFAWEKVAEQWNESLKSSKSST